MLHKLSGRNHVLFMNTRANAYTIDLFLHVNFYEHDAHTTDSLVWGSLRLAPVMYTRMSGLSL